MATTISSSLIYPILSLSSIPRPNHIPSSSLSSITFNSHLPRPQTPSTKPQFFLRTPHSVSLLSPTQRWRIPAFRQNLLLLEADPVENSQLVESATTDDGVSSIISALLFAAFIGLSILSIGIIYIAVTDFLQKREREKFEKEEAAKKKSGKKGKVRARAGPRGFGQKIEEEEE